MQNKFNKRGFNIYAVTDDDNAVVEGNIKKHGINYPVIQSKAFYADANWGEDLGRGTMYLINPAGNLETILDPADPDPNGTHHLPAYPQVEEWLKAVPPRVVDKDLNKGVADVVKKFNSGEYGNAAKEIEKLLKNEKQPPGEADKADAAYISLLIDRHEKAANALMHELVEAKDYLTLKRMLTRWKDCFSDHPFGETAKAKLKALDDKGEKEIKAELSAQEALEPLLESLYLANGEEGDKPREKAMSGLMEFAKTHANTVAGARAQAVLNEANGEPEETPPGDKKPAGEAPEKAPEPLKDGKK